MEIMEEATGPTLKQRSLNWSTTRRALSRSLHALVVLVLFSALATAQEPPGKWEVEFHGGWTQASGPTGVTASLPGPGESFTTLSGRRSRHESSWYFGDGALLLNQVNAAFGIAPRITPLDPALQSPVSRRSDSMFGFRVSRQITTRFTAELSLDYNRGQLEITDAVMSAIEASRASFISAWNGVFATAPPLFVSSVVTSTSAIQNREGRQIFTTGAIDINLTKPGRVTPFAILGAGLISNIGNTPSVTLAGKYQFLFGGAIPVTETDTVNVRYSIPGHALAGVIGGGFKYAVSPRSGVRVDVRAHLSNNAIDTLVDATPAVLTTTPGGFGSATTPSLQFASNPPVLNSPSTLSGPPIAGFRSFAGTGIQSQVSVAAGWFWRF